MKRRIGILTSGGDCPGLNACIRGVARASYELFDAEIVGIADGYRGLIEGDYTVMKPEDFHGILTLGGTILGTSRRPYRYMRVIEDDNVDKVENMKKNYKKMGLDCLVTLGGNGTHKTANLLSEEGLNVIGLPKTIDNDTWGTDMTFGFPSAIDIATKAIDDIKTTASSHGRVFVIEIMGHKVGWIPLYAGVAGGADVILIPEIPYDFDNVVKAIEQREKHGGRFAIIVVAEGAITKEEAALPKKEYKARLAQRTDPSVAYSLARDIEARTGRETRVAIPGHTQRGGAPDAEDRIFASQCGAVAGHAIVQGDYGFLVAKVDGKMTRVPLADIAGKLKYVDPKSDLVREARELGISFGDK